MLILGAGVVLVLMWIFSTVSKTQRHDVVTGYGDKIGLVELTGTITSSDDIVRQIKKYREDNDIRAILLRVDSPGGGVVASHEMYDEVRKTRDHGKPIVVSMGALAASGGYYVSLGASKIVANPGTLTGSIGVISEFLQYDTLFHKLGLSTTTIKSGKLKDAGSPLRPMNGEDKKYFQDLMDDVHRQFIAIVERERKLNHDSLVAIADGRVFTGTQAKALRLIDTIGTYQDAIAITAALGGIKGQPAIVHEERERSGFLDFLFGDNNARALFDLQEEILHKPILQYRLFPGL